MSGNWEKIELHLSEVLGRNIKFLNIVPVSGGCISQAWKVTDTKNKCWFVKTNPSPLNKVFEVEAQGLIEIKESACIRVPKVITFREGAEFSYLILEYISISSSVNQKLMGQQLALMHKYPSSEGKFGWKYNNTIGATAQSNRLSECWVEFWKNERLLFQLKMAKSKGYSPKAYAKGLKLADSLNVFFSDYQPKPSLLHGDLWGGNCGSDIESNPVIFDPAVYYGDREADIAMTELFGGFDQLFYDEYNEMYCLDSGYKTRRTLYNLYHILNHYNLFGGSYATQAEDMINRLLSEIN